jgi:tyrosinase-like protein/polyphenol oxidase-like protein
MITRRKFIRTTSAAAAAAAASSLFDARSLFAAGPFVRRDIGGLTATDSVITSYQTAIAAMQALPASDPLSWTYQAAIHGTAASPLLTSWNTCEHGTLEFLSWHRMYLWFFERIIRKMSGDPNWALPYWNYESPTERQLPSMFRSPSIGNPLYVSDRGIGWNDGTSSLPPSAVNSAPAMAEIPFGNFSSFLEGTPHAAVHITISGWMGSIYTAAQDPIFWLHHCNIDRYWNLWLAQGGGRSDPLTDAAWKTTPFTFFDENGNAVVLTGCDVLRAQEQLDYIYEGEPAQVNEYCSIKFPNPKWLKFYIIKWPDIILPPLPDPPPYVFEIERVRERLIEIAKDPRTDVTLDFDVEADVQPNTFYEIYLGMPRGVAPQSGSPFYVGNIAFFGFGTRQGGHQHHGNFQPASFSFKADEAIIAALLRQDVTNAGGGLTLTIVPRGADRIDQREPVKPAATLRISNVSLSGRRLQPI